MDLIKKKRGKREQKKIQWGDERKGRTEERPGERRE